MARLSRRLPAAVRLFIALAVLGLFLYAYLEPGIASNRLLAALAGTQFSAALYGAGVSGAAVIVFIILALFFGRVFCSAFCPLGTLQELAWRLGNLLTRGGKNASRLIRRGYVPATKWRYSVPLLVGAAAALAFSPLMMLFDPISSFGRGLGAIRTLAGGGAVFFAAIIALPAAAILIAALFRGRAFCGWCPVGLTLGLFSRFALFGMRINQRCISCGLCEKKCPSGCINSKEKYLDNKRCVLCFSCAAACPATSVVYGLRIKAGKPANSAGPAAPPDKVRDTGRSRRGFLKDAGQASLLCGAAYLLGPSLKLFSRAADGGNAGISAADQTADGAKLPILPPGALNYKRYRSRCTGCQACVASCPVGVIKVQYPAIQPGLDYSAASCQFNCIECGKVCPTGAIRRLDVEEKRRTRVALSELFFDRCVVKTKRESCGACAEVCPTAALTMIPYGESGVSYLTQPVFDEQYCIGCGACYTACPARPQAFTITAVAAQTLSSGARPAEEPGQEPRVLNTDDFPF